MATPALSLIVIAYRMSTQLQRTLQTLTADYQTGVSAHDYEVIVVENNSSDELSAEQVQQLPSNFHYFFASGTGAQPGSRHQFCV